MKRTVKKMSKSKKMARRMAMLLSLVLVLNLIPLSVTATNFICGKEEHTHTAECYGEAETIEYTCTPKDPYIHTHDEMCYDETGSLACTLDEVQEHTHTDACYTKMPDEKVAICGQEEVEPHTHTDDCYAPSGNRILACPESHEHIDSCYMYVPDGFRYKTRAAKYDDLPMQFEMPDMAYAGARLFPRVIYTDPDFESKVEKIEYTIRDVDYKQTGTEPYWRGVIPEYGIDLNTDTSVDRKYSIVIYVKYTNEAGETVRHYDAIDSTFTLIAQEQELTCGKEETEGHIHTDECYEIRPGELELTCGLPERHIHNESCYNELGELICEKAEAVVHQHADTCRVYIKEQKLICTIEEHTHTDACLNEVVVIDGKEYPVSEFTPMNDFLTSAILTSDGVVYDLMDKNLVIGDINAYREISVALSWMFQAEAGNPIGELYSWSFRGINLPESKDGPLENEDGKVFGHYYIDTHGTVYIVMSEEGQSQSMISCSVSFGARWESSSDGKVIVDLGNGCITEINLDMSRASVEKKVTGSHTLPGIWNYNVDVFALDDITITSIDDLVRFGNGSSYMKAWSEKSGVPLCEAFWMQDVEIRLPDGTSLSITEDQILVEPNGEDGIQYHIELNEPIQLQSDESLELIYNIQADPELVIYMDLMDVVHYQLGNNVTIFLDNDESISSNDAAYRFHERDLITKDVVILDEGSKAEWYVEVIPGSVYSLDGMMIQDTIIPEFEYLPDSFSYKYGAEEGHLDYHICVDQAEFDSLTAENAEGVVYLFGNTFKFFIPDGGTPDSAFSLRYSSTYNAEKAAAYGQGARLNKAQIWYKDMYDEDSDGIISEDIIKRNDGIHVDNDGLLFTNWSAELHLPKNTAYEAFHFEDYVPMNGSLYDTLHLNRDLDDGEKIKCNNLEEVRALGIDLSVITQSGNDITADIFGYFWIEGIMVASDDTRYFTMAFADKASVEESGWKNGGMAAMDEDYTVTITVPMYLSGDSTTFREHTNSIVWYYTKDWNSHSGESVIILPYINNDDLLNKTVVGSELSEDGTKTILTYQVRYDMTDKLERNGYIPGSGFKFSDKLKDTTYERYVPGSLKVYWTKGITNNDYWIYQNETSPYNGETNLLAIEEDVRHKVTEENDKYERLATLVSETESGYEVYIPYYMPTNNFRWTFEGDGTQRFYSPLFEYQVEVNMDALEQDKQWHHHVQNEVRARLTDGTLDATSAHDHVIDLGAMKKAVVQVPTKENEYIVKYQLVIDATSAEIQALDRLDVIDTMNTSAAKLLADEMVIEHSADKVNWDTHNAQQVMYDRESREITCLLTNNPAYNYYRITYALQLSGMAGDKLSVSNTAYVVGYKEQESGTTDSFIISDAGGNADGTQARIDIYKYNRDDLSMGLEGALFKLSACSAPAETLDNLNTRAEVLAAIKNEDWQELAQAHTDTSGNISWQHNQDGISLPMNVLLKLEEMEAPSGYLLSNQPIYFYLSPTNASRTDHLRYFDREPIRTSIPVANSRGAFVVEKQDAKSGALLSGAEFWLYPQEGGSNDAIKAVERDNGIYYFGNLELGMTYTLKEITAPEGYILDDTLYTVSVANNGSVAITPSLRMNGPNYIFENRLLSTAVLPETGGLGGHIYVLAGLALILAAIGYMSLPKRR